jgi:hypothetical protein
MSAVPGDLPREVRQVVLSAQRVSASPEFCDGRMLRHHHLYQNSSIGGRQPGPVDGLVSGFRAVGASRAV